MKIFLFLDLNFFSAEAVVQNTFLEDFIIAVAAALIGTITTWFIFKRTLSENRKIEGRKIKISYIENLGYLKILVESTIKYINDQTKLLKDFSLGLKSDNSNFGQCKLLISRSIKSITSKVDHEKYFHSYCDRYQYSTIVVEEFQSIFIDCEYFDKKITTLITDIENFRNNHNERRSTMRDILIKIETIIRDNQNEIKKINAEIIPYYVDYKKKEFSKEFDPKNHYELFILPLSTIVPHSSEHEIALSLKSFILEYDLILKTNDYNIKVIIDVIDKSVTGMENVMVGFGSRTSRLVNDSLN